MEISDEEGSDSEIFISDEARRRFIDNISGRSLFSERGFIMDFDHETLGLPSIIASLILTKKWGKFCQQPKPYNVQVVKEFYANLKPSNKNVEVMVRGCYVSYSEGTINMICGLKKKSDNDLYQEILERADETEYEVFMQSLCNPGTKWIEVAGEKSVKRMDLLPEAKAWYQFIKHSVKPTTHNETVNKQRLALLHCITAGNDVNVGKIVMQEIQACARKKDGMLYFPCLITALCVKQGVRDRDTDEISNPKVGFDRTALQLLMRPRPNRKEEEGQVPDKEEGGVENGNNMWKLLQQIQQDQRDFFKFQKIKHEWEARVYKNLDGNEMPPPFPDHILGVVEEEEEKEAKRIAQEKKKGKEPMKESLKKTVSDPSASTTGMTRQGPKMRFPKKTSTSKTVVPRKKTVDVTPSMGAKKKETVMPKKDQKLKTMKERVEIVLEESSEEE